MLKEKIYKLIKLDCFEWGILVVSMFLLPFIVILLAIMGYKRSRKLLGLFLNAGSGNYVNQILIDKAYSIARMVNISSEYSFLKYNCLDKSIAIWWLLNINRMQCEIKFGVLLSSFDKFTAHAWVDYYGINLCDSNETNNKYIEFQEFPNPVY